MATKKEVLKQLAHIQQLLKNNGQKPIVLSIDQSINYTAYSVFKDGEVVFYDLLSTNLNIPNVKKNDLVLTYSKKIIKEQNVNVIVNEDIYNTNNTTYKVLAFLLGSFEYYAYKNDMHYLIIHPSTIKSHIGGYDVKDKFTDDMTDKKKKYLKKIHSVNYVKDKYGIDIIEYTKKNHQQVYKEKHKKGDFDIADAICIGDFVNESFKSFSKKSKKK